jgi:2-methylisocitrate lyase-like PEP mutase family enzyme
MSEQTRALREILADPGLEIVPECYSALTGRIVEEAGFRATYCGGSAMGGMHYAVPDHGLLTLTELIEVVARVAAAVSIPVISDADQGGETSLAVTRTVKCFERAGVSGIHIEDTLNPKHLGIHRNSVSPERLERYERLQPVAEMCARIGAAADARIDPDFVIIARTDELFNGGSVDAAIERGICYAEAGADAFMCLRMPAEEISRIAEAVPLPLVDTNVPAPVGVATPLKLSLFTGYSVFAAAETHRRWVDHVKGHGEYPQPAEQLAGRLPQDGLSREAYRKLVDDDHYVRMADDWTSTRDGS